MQCQEQEYENEFQELIRHRSKRKMSRRPCVGGHKNCEKTIRNTEQSGVCLVFTATKIPLLCRGKFLAKTSVFPNFSYHRYKTGGIIKLNAGFNRLFV